MLFYCVERCVANIMLNTAGVVRCRFFINAEVHKHLGQNCVALINMLRLLLALLCENDIAVCVNGYKTALFKQADAACYGRFCVTHMFADVNLPD